MQRVLFVCLGNICRSPAAEGIMNKLILDSELADRVQCESAGTSRYHIGALPDARMRMHASQRGFTLESKARQITEKDLDDFHYIMAMDEQNMTSLKAMAGYEKNKQKIHLMNSFCRHFKKKEVPDPYYDSEDGFKLVLDILMDAVTGLLYHIRSENKW